MYHQCQAPKTAYGCEDFFKAFFDNLKIYFYTFRVGHDVTQIEAHRMTHCLIQICFRSKCKQCNIQR